MREFESGAIRDTDEGKLDYEGFLSPYVLRRYAEYMHEKRRMPDGSMRDSDNWQRGIPPEQCMKSLLRHVMEVWQGMDIRIDAVSEDDLCAVIFNAQAMLLALMKEHGTLYES